MSNPKTIALVCGGRGYAALPRDRAPTTEDKQRVSDEKSRLYKALSDLSPDVVITGDARGADRAAGGWARNHATMLVDVPALWEVHGNRAGPIRNGQMLSLLQMMGANGKEPRTLVVAFPGGSGTADMVRRSKAAGVEVIEVAG